MASFLYTARNLNGLAQSGYLDAGGEEEVVAILQNRGLIITSLSRRDGAALEQARRRTTRPLHGRVSADDKVLFCQQLATLLDAGVTLLKSLEVLSAQVESRSLLVAIEQMRRDIEAGRTFRDALARHPRIFSSFWLNLVETGEASGHLAQSLGQLASYLESARNLQSKAITALTYPAVLICAAIVALSIFLLKIIPIFKGVFSSMNVELPLLTQMVLAASNLARRHALVGALGLFVALYLLRQFLRTQQGRWIADLLLLKVPILRRLFTQLQLAQFARGLSALLGSGVPILASLEIMGHSATNRLYGRAIGQIREFVREGRSMAEPMEQNGLFPPMMIQMVQVGEEVGELGKMLDRVAKYYEQRVDTFVERMSALFEPIAIIVMALIIGTIVVSIFLPIFSLATGSSG